MPETKSLQPAEVHVEPVLAVQTARKCAVEPEEISVAMQSAFAELYRFAGGHQLQFTGPPRAIYHSHGPEGTRFVLAIPIGAPSSDVAAEGAVDVGTLAGGKTLRFTHTGPYRDLERTYDAIAAWMMEEGLLRSEADWGAYAPLWEEYATDPQSTPESESVTYIHVPVE